MIDPLTSSLRKQGPITTGVQLKEKVVATPPKTKLHGVWVPAYAGTTSEWSERVRATRWLAMTMKQSRYANGQAQENVALTVPSPDNSMLTLSPAFSHTVLTRLPVSTISPARRPLPSLARWLASQASA